jgi:TatA/E family protein of Tat protein translocase
VDINILGIGPLELVVILIVALAVFGPDRLPQIGSKLGRAMKDMRRATRAFSREIDQARAAIEGQTNEVSQPLQDAGASLKEIATAAQAFRNPGQALRQSIMKELKPGEPAPDAQAANAAAAAAAPAAAPAAANPAAAAESPAEALRIAPPNLASEPAATTPAAAQPEQPQPDADAPRDPQQPSSGTEA